MLTKARSELPAVAGSARCRRCCWQASAMPVIGTPSAMLTASSALGTPHPQQEPRLTLTVQPAACRNSSPPGASRTWREKVGLVMRIWWRRGGLHRRCVSKGTCRGARLSAKDQQLQQAPTVGCPGENSSKRLAAQAQNPASQRRTLRNFSSSGCSATAVHGGTTAGTGRGQDPQARPRCGSVRAYKRGAASGSKHGQPAALLRLREQAAAHPPAGTHRCPGSFAGTAWCPGSAPACGACRRSAAGRQ